MPILANASFLTIKNRDLANPYILANAYSGESLRAPTEENYILTDTGYSSVRIRMALKSPHSPVSVKI